MTSSTRDDAIICSRRATAIYHRTIEFVRVGVFLKYNLKTQSAYFRPLPIERGTLFPVSVNPIIPANDISLSLDLSSCDTRTCTIHCHYPSTDLEVCAAPTLEFVIDTIHCHYVYVYT